MQERMVLYNPEQSSQGDISAYLKDIKDSINIEDIFV